MPDRAACPFYKPINSSPVHAENNVCVKHFAFPHCAIRCLFTAARGLKDRRREEEDALIAFFSGPGSLSAALRRTGVQTHQTIVKRRGMGPPAEVPLFVAATAFDSAIMDAITARSDREFYNEVPFDSQVFLSTRWFGMVK